MSQRLNHTTSQPAPPQIVAIRTELPNGLVILTERMTSIRSVTLGIWLRAGSRHEPPHLNGITHFLEHLLFKGTKNRSTRQIAIESDHLGGAVDAFTMRECTGFHIQTLDHRLAEGFDLLADLVLNPLFDPEELERERKVILEEMKMVEDTPDELVFEKFTARFWNGHGLGRPIEGTAETVESFTRDGVRQYFEKIFIPANFVITAAGNLEHDQIVELANRYFGSLPAGTAPLEEDLPHPTLFVDAINKPYEQAHLILGVVAPPLLSNFRFTCNLLSTVLGGGLSSRLFQRIREEEGLAYTVYSDVNAVHDAGCLNIYAAVSPANLRRTVELIMAEISALVHDGVSDEELQRAREQLLTGILLALESSASRAAHLARQEIVYQKVTTTEEIIQEINAVTANDVKHLAEHLFQTGKIACLTLGPGRKAVIPAKLLKITSV
jgi:predicted Zn-dependent peptidase